jgi:hypothetical protein
LWECQGRGFAMTFTWIFADFTQRVTTVSRDPKSGPCPGKNFGVKMKTCSGIRNRRADTTVHSCQNVNWQGRMEKNESRGKRRGYAVKYGIWAANNVTSGKSRLVVHGIVAGSTRRKVNWETGMSSVHNGCSPEVERTRDLEAASGSQRGRALVA